MPRLVEGSEVSGQLRDALAATWGLPKAVVVAGGGGDNAAAAVGVGVVRRAKRLCRWEHRACYLRPTIRYQPDAATAVHTFCHAVAKHMAPDGGDLGRELMR